MFRSNGDHVSKTQDRGRSRIEGYREQLVYTNVLLRELVEQLQAGSKRPPVIVLQGDEGPTPLAFHEMGPMPWKDATDLQLKRKMGILNAIHLPAHSAAPLARTPVNTFRWIFNATFGSDYELLEEECYSYEDRAHPYALIRITDRILDDLTDNDGHAGGASASEDSTE